MHPLDICRESAPIFLRNLNVVISEPRLFSLVGWYDASSIWGIEEH